MFRPLFLESETWKTESHLLVVTLVLWVVVVGAFVLGVCVLAEFFVVFLFFCLAF